ncbi:MAG: DUF4115 domain-containing protein [Anaerolineales bacterium]|nr:DUF4115 domain-containing protein [Anaerolineales bacterium]MCX7754117.1 DUF4115 domain-containing protein [Anaerolineales bacterium]MDW8278031.1 DUF4115 domain-containing protein [Anaerolineales bacterium]
MASIGERLKQARKARKLTLKQAVQATRIRSYYLEALEADDWTAIPSPVQARGFLRSYAEYLGLDFQELTGSEATPGPLSPSSETSQATAPEPPRTPRLPPATETEPPPPPAPPQPAADSPTPTGEPTLSERILLEIGKTLRERRELLSLTLDEIERHTRIRRHHLEKIETGKFDDLPSPVQARGLLNAYANFLDLDADALLLRYAEALQIRRQERQAPVPTRKRRTTPHLPFWFRQFLSADLVFGGGMILLLFGMAVWGAGRLFTNNRTATEPTATEGPSISEVLLASPVSENTLTPEFQPTSVPELGTLAPTDAPPQSLPATVTPFIEFAPAPGVQLTLLVAERTYLKVIVDGEVKQEGRVVPGAALKFEGKERIEVLTGSGAAIQVIYNQQNLGVLGSLGEVVNRIYTRNGVETPTPTPSPTGTATPRRSPTPTPTLTVTATNTPTPPR